MTLSPPETEILRLAPSPFRNEEKKESSPYQKPNESLRSKKKGKKKRNPIKKTVFRNLNFIKAVFQVKNGWRGELTKLHIQQTIGAAHSRGQLMAWVKGSTEKSPGLKE